MSNILVEDEEPDPPKGVLETALWCGHCFLPSAVRVPVVLQAWAAARTPLARREDTIIVCLDCGRPLAENGDPLGGPVPGFPGMS